MRGDFIRRAGSRTMTVVWLLALPVAGCAVGAAEPQDESAASNGAALRCPGGLCLDGPIERIELPPRIIKELLPNPEDFVSITAGMHHTCARKNNGNV